MSDETTIERAIRQRSADFLACYHAHFDSDSAFAHELGKAGLGPATSRRWKFSGNVVAGDMADEALDAYLREHVLPEPPASTWATLRRTIAGALHALGEAGAFSAGERADVGIVINLLVRGRCCERDHDGDGNCDVHPAWRPTT